MSQPVTPAGDLPKCIWCEGRERNGEAPAICYHLAGDPVDRRAWFAARKPKKHRHDFRDGDACSKCDALKAVG